MRIESGCATSVKSGLNSGDHILNSIEKQITKLQEKLKKIDVDDNLSLEEKIDQKKEINDQINILRQQQMQRKTYLMQQNKKESEVNQKSENEDAVVLDDHMKAMITASGAMNQINSAHSVKTKLEVEKNTLNSEIELDAGRGLDVSDKVQREDKLSAKIQEVTNDMIEIGQETKKAFNETENDDKDTLDKNKNEDNNHVDVLI